MKGKSKRGIVIITLILVIVVLLSLHIVGLIPGVQQSIIQEETQVANSEKEEVLAGSTVKLSTEQKKTFMEEKAKGWDTSKVNKVTDTNGVPVPVPKGYSASNVTGEHTVDSGFVIYEGESVVSGTSTSSDVLNAQKTRNQWVWVPIYDVDEIYGTDASGNIHGKLYNYSENENNKRTALNWSETGGVMTIIDSTKYREPDLINTSTSFDNDHYLPNYMSEEERSDFDLELKEEFLKQIESIKIYGGFYIGRYETGGLYSEAKVVKMNTEITSHSWYESYEKIKGLREKNNNIGTSMIFGCMWDATFQWLLDTNAVSYSEIASNSLGWGNYFENSIDYTDIDGKTQKTQNEKIMNIPAGSSETTKKNNIYDMAGNILDFTIEAGLDELIGRAGRGGTGSSTSDKSAGEHKIKNPNTSGYRS